MSKYVEPRVHRFLLMERILDELVVENTAGDDTVMEPSRKLSMKSGDSPKLLIIHF